jgi:hypothetical protein
MDYYADLIIEKTSLEASFGDLLMVLYDVHAILNTSKKHAIVATSAIMVSSFKLLLYLTV